MTKYITCPHCLGNEYLTCILGDGTQVTFDCICCDSQYNREDNMRRGKISIYEIQGKIEPFHITGIEINNNKVRYISGTNCQRSTINENELYATPEETKIHAEIKKAEIEVEQQSRIENTKENARKSWAWNVTYHRNRLKQAQRDLEYHTQRLNVAKEKAKQYQKTGVES